MAQAPGRMGPVSVTGSWWEGSALWGSQEPVARDSGVTVYLGLQIG